MIGYVASQQFNRGILQCPGLVRYQELDGGSVGADK